MLSPVMLGMSEETTLTLKQKCFWSNFRQLTGPTRVKMKGGPNNSRELIHTQVSVTFIS